MKQKWKNILLILLPALAAVLALLPEGIGLVFAGSPEQSLVRYYPIFNVLPVGYGMFFPFLAAYVSVALIVLGIIRCFRPGKVLTELLFWLSLLAFLMSTQTLLFALTGGVRLTWVSVLYCLVLLAQLCLSWAVRKQALPE